MAVHDRVEPSAEPAENTRRRIVQAARELVVEHGYAGVNISQVQVRAGVSRGGLYHHFSGRQELMAAVIEAIEVDLSQRLAAAVESAPDPMTALETGVQWYLDECLRSPELQRIGLYEGRQALGWEAWREAVAPYGVSLLVAALEEGVAAGQIAPVDASALAYLILALLHEAATIILSDADQPGARARVGSTVAVVISGLRVESAA